MSCEYQLVSYFRVRERKEYPWPCSTDQSRRLELWPEDVLTKRADGTVTKHNGLCMFGIHVPDEDLEAVDEPQRMVLV